MPKGIPSKQSAGTLLYRRSEGAVEVLLVHPSGAYNRHAPWSIPKGIPDDGEADLEATARRETFEETGVRAGPLTPLGFIDYKKSSKRVHCFAGPAPAGADPRTASWEVDQARFARLEEARGLLHPDQRPFLDRLAEHLTSAEAAEEMSHPWHDVRLPEDVEAWFPVFVEIPMGSKVKYELDKSTGLLRVDRVLYSAVHYPANYGFVPRTYCDDGDPLDVLVLGEEVAPGVLVRAHAIGVMRMRDDKGIDDKIIAVHVDDPSYAGYHSIKELAPHRLRELQRFFMDYKTLEGKTVEVDEPLGPDEARRVMLDAIALYNQEHNRLR